MDKKFYDFGLCVKMNKFQKKWLKDNVRNIIEDRSLTFCAILIKSEPDAEVRKVLEEVYKILNADSDIIGMYYMVSKRLAHGTCKTEAEKFALEIIKRFGSDTLREARELAKDKINN